MSKITKAKISDLIDDDLNANKGCEFGDKLMDKSFSKFGAGRSILLDRNNKVIAGNKSKNKFGELGGENVLIVEADKNTLVAVRRNDIDLDTPEGREFAIADNATNKANLVWDVEVIDVIAESVDVVEWGVEKTESDEGYGTDFSLPDGDKAPFQQMTFTLADEQAEQIKNAIADIKQTEEYKYAETMGNENSNGNALYLIVMQWAEQRK